VRHVENFTDVNEKIVARVGEDELGESEADVAETYIQRTIDDMRSLNLLRAEVYPASPSTSRDHRPRRDTDREGLRLRVQRLGLLT